MLPDISIVVSAMLRQAAESPDIVDADRATWDQREPAFKSKRSDMQKAAPPAIMNGHRSTCST
jgi:hypothetical protein